MKRFFALALVMALLALGLPAQGAELSQSIEGKSACLMELATGQVIYEQNAHEKLAPASVTKVMTLLLIMEAIDGGTLAWTDTVTASPSAAAKGGSQIYLKAGETMSVADMVKSIAVSSANDCACAMAEHLAGSEAAFVESMNRRAGELGMADTHFVNCTGLDDSPEASQHRTSAYDIALMSRELLKNHPDIKRYTTIWMDTVRGGAFGLVNTNKLVRFYNGCTGLKTGFTSGAGYCLSAAAQRQGMELIAVIMGAESSAQRFTACRVLLDHGFAHYTLVTPQLESAVTGTVKLGTASTVPLVPEQSPPLLLEKAQAGSVTREVTLEESVAAPIAQGQRMGTLTLRCGDRILGQVSLVAARAVPRLTIGQLFWQILRKITL